MLLHKNQEMGYTDVMNGINFGMSGFITQPILWIIFLIVLITTILIAVVLSWHWKKYHTDQGDVFFANTAFLVVSGIILAYLAQLIIRY